MALELIKNCLKSTILPLSFISTHCKFPGGVHLFPLCLFCNFYRFSLTMRLNFFSLKISASSQEYVNEEWDVISPYADHIILRPALTFDGNGSYHLQAPPLLGAFRISLAYQSSAFQGREALGDSYAYSIGWELLHYIVFQLSESHFFYITVLYLVLYSHGLASHSW